MVDLYVWLAAASLIVATYIAALTLALLRSSRSAITQLFENRGRPAAGGWLAARFDSAIFAASLLRTIARVAFFVFVLAETVDLATQVPLRWDHLLVSGLISVALLWLFTSVIAASVARHVGASLIVGSLPVLRLLTSLFFPLTRAVSFVDEVVRRLSGAGPLINESEAELLRSIEETQREGGLDKTAASMLENVVEFANKDVAEIMTPRTDVQGLELTDDLTAIRSFIGDVGHSRIPVYRENLDHVAGILYVKDLIPFLGEGADDFRLEPLLRQPIFVPETKPVRELLGDFQRSEIHMAIVIDEYGGTEGLVTIEDVLEEIVGEIRDEHEPGNEEEPTLVTIDERRAEVDGRYHIDDLNEHLGLDLPEDADFDTVGGFVMAELGHVPRVGESFEAHNARFTTLATATTHVRRVGIELLGAAPGAGRGTANGE